MNFIVYDTVTGELKRKGTCPENMLSGQAYQANEAVIEGDVDLLAFRVVDGALTPLPPEVVERRRAKPRPDETWDWTTMQWSDSRSPAAVREDRWREVKLLRTQHEFSTFVWDGSTFDADAKSQQRIQAAVMAAMAAKAEGKPFSITWTLADNSVRTLGADDMIALGRAMSEHVARCHEAGRALRAAIAASDIEAVKMTVWADEYHRAIRQTGR